MRVTPSLSRVDEIEADFAPFTRSDDGDIRVGAVGDWHLRSGEFAAGDACAATCAVRSGRAFR